MSFKLGITGGIGSGKTLVCKIFTSLGIPVYNADERAKSLIQNDSGIRESIKKEFGDSAYLQNGTYNRQHIAELVFNNPERLAKLNSIVHPVVKADYLAWQLEHTGYPITVREAAIMFESGSHLGLEMVVTVTAPDKIRINRVMERDHKSSEAVKQIMQNQWPDEERIRRSDFVILNDNRHSIINQVLNLVETIQTKIGKHT